MEHFVDEVTNAAESEVDLKDGVVEEIVQSSYKNAALSAEELAMLDAEMKADVAPKKSMFSNFFGRRKLLKKKNKDDGGGGDGGGNWGANRASIDHRSTRKAVCIVFRD